MRNILIIISSLILFGCNKSDLKQVWIGTHYYSLKDSTLTDNLPRHIFYFENDSVYSKQFYKQFIGEDNAIRRYSYTIKNDEIIIPLCDYTQFSYSIKDNVMKQRYGNYINYYKVLPTYNHVKNASKLYNELISSTFEFVGDSLQFEFQDNHKFIKNKIDNSLSDNQIWMLDSFQNELFLVIDCSFNCSKSFFHITEITKNGFQGVQYGKEHKIYTFRKIPKYKTYATSDLLGKWERYYDDNHEFYPPPPELPKSHPHYRKWYNKEQLIIDDSTLVRYNGFRIDTVNWSMNREQEQLLFSKWKHSTSLDTRQWEIKELQEKELIVKRINREYDGYTDYKLETVKFVRKQ